MDDGIQLHLDAMKKRIGEESKDSEEAFDKLTIALTGVFRLLDGKQSMLTSLKGSPTEIQAYILQLLGQIRQNIALSYERLLTEFEELSSQTKNP